jgi:RNA 2',3'-cyclic 3'-phosphodiesterase
VSDASPERIRLFVALELPDAVRAALVRWRDSALVPALRPVPGESLHVTLCFLGSLPSADVPAIGDACAVAVAGERPLPLAVGSVAWLPRGRPQVLSVAIDDPSGELAHRQAALSGVLVAGGWYRPESRPFLAHVTVARVRRGERLRAAQLVAPPELGFSASRVTLFRSHLGAGGVRYEALRVS